MSHRFRGFSLRTPNFHIAAAGPASIFEPSVFSAVDPHGINGHGFGFGENTHITAIGEYLERHTAFRTIRHTHGGRIDDMSLSQSEQTALTYAMQQTCEIKDIDKIIDHEFKLVSVRRLVSNDECLYPAILFSLSGFHDDADFFPVRDTSGTAIHRHKQTAFRTALLEFVERQCTTAMWASRRCNAIGSFAQTLANHEKAATTYSRMSCNGKLEFYDISFIKGAIVIFGKYTSEKKMT